MISRVPQSIMIFASLVILLATGCESALDESAYDEAEIRTTLVRLEDQLNLGVDALQCGLPEVGEGDPIFVSNGFVVRSASELRELCVDIVEPRTRAEWQIDTVSVNILSRNIALVVREGTYTMHFKERESLTVDPVITTIWHRLDGQWKMVHLHESSVEMF